MKLHALHALHALGPASVSVSVSVSAPKIALLGPTSGSLDPTSHPGPPDPISQITGSLDPKPCLLDPGPASGPGACTLFNPRNVATVSPAY
eukprot:3384669-Rhodomonas_salina.1